MSALFPFNLNAWYGLPAQGVAVDDWADDNFDHAGLDFIGGGNLWVISDRRPIGAAGMNTFGRAPALGHRSGRRSSRRTPTARTASYIQKTTLPYEDNYLDLDPDGEGSARATRSCRITGGVQGERAEDRGVHARTRWSSGTGRPARSRSSAPRVGGAMGASTHAYGGTRMGDNPETNVVEPLGLLARGAEPRRPRRVGDGHERRPQPDAHGAGARLANGRVPGRNWKSVASA